MPNQRKKGKVFVGGYIPKELAESFKAVADGRGMTVKDLLEELIRKDLGKDGNDGK